MSPIRGKTRTANERRQIAEGLSILGWPATSTDSRFTNLQWDVEDWQADRPSLDCFRLVRVDKRHLHTVATC